MMKRTFLPAVLTAILAVILAACAAAPAPATDVPQTVASAGRYRGSWSYNSLPKYTKADYDLALSFRTQDYEKQSVAAFDRSVMDWDNEAAYHKTEEALDRLFSSLPDDDANAGFILGTLGNTWRNAEKKHYSTCERDKSPWHSGWASCETFGDVFGDKVLLSGGYADFRFSYQIPDEQALTVGERDALLQSVEDGMAAFLNSQTADACKAEKTMTASLKAELERLLTGLDKKIAWTGESDLWYDWDQSYDFDEYDDADDDAYEPAPSHYTQAQYDLVRSTLLPDGYESLSVAAYNRLVNTAFTNYDDNYEMSLQYAYEMLMMSLPERDPIYDALHGTVQTAQDEYNTRIRAVTTGKDLDYAVEDYYYADWTEDVFGDEVTVGGVSVEYAFTYRILNQDSLTVRERDAFLSAVRTALENYLRSDSSEKPTKAGLQAAMDAAGKSAGTPNIAYTGCSVDTFEFYR